MENNKIITFAPHLYLTDSFEIIKFTHPNDTNLTFRLHLISPLQIQDSPYKLRITNVPIINLRAFNLYKI